MFQIRSFRDNTFVSSTDNLQLFRGIESLQTYYVKTEESILILSYKILRIFKDVDNPLRCTENRFFCNTIVRTDL